LHEWNPVIRVLPEARRSCPVSGRAGEIGGHRQAGAAATWLFRAEQLENGATVDEPAGSLAPYFCAASKWVNASIRLLKKSLVASIAM
jgi:hypothetical protein